MKLDKDFNYICSKLKVNKPVLLNGSIYIYLKIYQKIFCVTN